MFHRMVNQSRVAEKVCVAKHHALRRTGRARRVLHKRYAGPSHDRSSPIARFPICDQVRRDPDHGPQIWQVRGKDIDLREEGRQAEQELAGNILNNGVQTQLRAV